MLKSHFLAVCLSMTAVVFLHVATAQGQPYLPTFEIVNPSNSMLRQGSDAYEGFGEAISASENLVLVGAKANAAFLDSGTATLIDGTTGQTLHTFRGTAGGEFGRSVSVHVGKSAIGEPSDNVYAEAPGRVHIYDNDTGQRLLTITDQEFDRLDRDYDGFGESVSLKSSHVFIGEPKFDSDIQDIGAAHLYDSTTGDLVFSIENPEPVRSIANKGDLFGERGNLFGSTVALNDNIAAVAAPGQLGQLQFNGIELIDVKHEGAVHLFDLDTGSLSQTLRHPKLAELTDTHIGFGRSLIVSSNYVIVGTDLGEVFVFDSITGNELHSIDSTTFAGTNFLVDSLAADSEKFAITGIQADRRMIYLFDLEQGGLLQTLVDPTEEPPNGFNVSHSFGEQLAVTPTVLTASQVVLKENPEFPNNFMPDVLGSTQFFLRVPEPSCLLILSAMLATYSFTRRQSAK